MYLKTFIYENHIEGGFNDSLDYKSYHKFINQRIFCSDEAFAPYGNRYALKRQLVNLPCSDKKGCIQYKKKQLDFSINQIATYLYHPIIKSSNPQSNHRKVVVDMRTMLIGPVMRRTIKTGNLIQWFYIMHTLLIML